MRSRTIAWFLGTLLLCQLPSLPTLPWAAALLGLAVVTAHPAGRPWHLVTFALIGFMWAGWQASAQLGIRDGYARLPRDLLIEGVVDRIPATGRLRTRFELRISRLFANGRWHDGEGRWRIDWYDARSPVVPGERWRLPVRRSRFDFPATPGGFDRSRYLFRQRIAATGYVRSDSGPVRLTSAPSWHLDRLRQRLSERIHAELPGRSFSGVLAALGVGDRQRLTPHQRSVLADTGTAHLMAISGLHVGLVGALGLLLGSSIWRALPALVSRVPAKVAGGVVAFVAASGYAALAGFALPTQRALSMLAVVILALVCRRPQRVSRSLALALLLTLIVDPLAPLDPGFWLSFGAVGCILWMFAGRLRRPSPMRAWFRLQLGLTIFLLPVGFTLFGKIVPAALPANLVAVPWVSVAVIPPVLAATGLATLELPGVAALLGLAERAMETLWPLLEWLSDWGVAPHAPAPNSFQLTVSLLGVAMILAPAGLPGRVLGLFMLVPLFIPGLPNSTTVATVALLGSENHAPVVVAAGGLEAALVDTGRRGRGSGDPGKTLIAPYLAHRGIRGLDAIILTGGDRSRTGGLRSARELSTDTRIHGPVSLVGQVIGLEPCAPERTVTVGRVTYDFPKAGEEHCPVRLTLMNRTVLIPGSAALDPEWWVGLPAPDVLVLDGASAAALPPGAESVVRRAAAVYVMGRSIPPELKSAYSSGACGSLEWQLDSRGAARVHCHASAERRFWHTVRPDG